ncbi:histidine phosphatase family protein [Sphingomonas sp. NFR15]|uniref:histidine phosphatase family protein n=1 Tax=Sphingomonas sp. NFR15 TaxID=1566282 RepID=UPI000883B059|nr:histidine phosphatase family protein [Sphingomonas sp. NFR15]SDA30922.1 Broad specificity phosphatase PhoE [Sphingomonas sp. NFR15]
MRIVILVRHGTHAEVGQILSGRSEIALGAGGRAEAAALATALDGTPVASLHVSPRRRARETATPFAARRALTADIAPALDEIDFGAFTGRAFADLDGDPEWFRWNAERATARCPGGETMAEACARAERYLAQLAPDGFPALCVTHCDVIRGLVVQQLGIGFERLFALECDPASRTTIDLDSGRVIALNERVRP